MKNSQNVKLGIWEEFYQFELKTYWSLVISKAKQVKRLERIDPFCIPDYKAKWNQRKLKHLKSELNTLVSFKECVDELKNTYLQTTVWLSEYHNRNRINDAQYILQLRNNCEFLQTIYINSSNQELMYLSNIYEIIKECHDKGLVLDSLKSIEL